MQDYSHLSALKKAASESVVFMILAMETVAAEEVDVSKTKVVAEDIKEEVDEVE